MHMPSRLNLLVAVSSLSVALTAAAFGDPRPVVLELFTSEGCSSCPPAEVLVSELARRPDVLALSFHVDYWDDLGWRDRYSLASATDRQRIYARTLRRPSVYTPQVIIDGLGDFVGSQRGAVTEALSGRRDGVATSTQLKDGTIQIYVGGASELASADVILVGYLREAITQIGRGENSGRTLRESNIVLSLHRLGKWSGKPQEFQMSADSLPKNATDIAVLVQSMGQGAILGAMTQRIR
jgi:hypothetical protein